MPKVINKAGSGRHTSPYTDVLLQRLLDAVILANRRGTGRRYTFQLVGDKWVHIYYFEQATGRTVDVARDTRLTEAALTAALAALRETESQGK